MKGNMENIPFADNSFDTVVSTHSLEHAADIERAVRELRRVAREKQIIVVPGQREYKYTFDLHLHFFPYRHSPFKYMRNDRALCRMAGNDIFFAEDINPEAGQGRPPGTERSS